MGLYTKDAMVTTYCPTKVVVLSIKNSLNQLATLKYHLTLLNVIVKAMTAQIDTWSALTIGPDFTGAAAAFFLGVSALRSNHSSI